MKLLNYEEKEGPGWNGIATVGITGSTDILDSVYRTLNDILTIIAAKPEGIYNIILTHYIFETWDAWKDKTGTQQSLDILTIKNVGGRTILIRQKETAEYLARVERDEWGKLARLMMEQNREELEALPEELEPVENPEIFEIFDIT